MKLLIVVLSIIAANSAMAVDMSKKEDYAQAYRERSDGTSEYIGRCSTHEDYAGKKFRVTKDLVETFEPNGMDEREFSEKVKVLEPELLSAANKTMSEDDAESILLNADDFTADKIRSLKFRKTDLYRLNIGVGGGNGMILVFDRQKKGTRIVYKLVSNTFDGEVIYCDSKVWLRRR